MPLSASPYLPMAAGLLATVFIGFGLNAILKPALGLTFFALPYPSTGPLAAPHKATIDALSAVYGVRDVFMGVAIYAAAYYGSSQALGVITLSAGLVAVFDGAVCKFMVGKGTGESSAEMNHWATHRCWWG